MLGCGLRVLSLLVAAAAAGYCTTEGGEEDATVLVQGDGPVWLHFYVAPASLAIPPPAMLLSLCWIGIYWGERRGGFGLGRGASPVRLGGARRFVFWAPALCVVVSSNNLSRCIIPRGFTTG